MRVGSRSGGLGGSLLRMATTWVGLTLLFGGGGALAAQAKPSQVGDWVRLVGAQAVTASKEVRAVGTSRGRLVRRTGDTVWIQAAGAELARPYVLTPLSRLDTVWPANAAERFSLGDRIRWQPAPLIAPRGPAYEGVVTGAFGDTLLVTPTIGALPTPFATPGAQVQVWERRGRLHGALHGYGRGFVGGFLVGAVLSTVYGRETEGQSRLAEAARVGTDFGILAAPIGLLLGLFSPGERWKGAGQAHELVVVTGR